MGFSMGAFTSHTLAANYRATQALNIGAAVSLHPGRLYERPARIPIFFAAGTRDRVTNTANIPEVFRLTKQPKVYANFWGMTHGG